MQEPLPVPKGDEVVIKVEKVCFAFFLQNFIYLNLLSYLSFEASYQEVKAQKIINVYFLHLFTLLLVIPLVCLRWLLSGFVIICICCWFTFKRI